MARAARLPSATASITIRGPNARSPPQYTPGIVVASVRGSTPTRPLVVIVISGSPARHAVSGCWPTARMIVSASMRFSLPSANRGLKRRFSSNTDSTSSVSSAFARPFSPRMAFGPRRGSERDALLLGLPDLVRVGRHLGAGLEADELDVPRAQPQRGAGGVEEGVVVAPGLEQLLRALGQLVRVRRGVAQDGAGHVDRHVAAAHDDDALAERDAVAEVRVQQEVDAVDHTVELAPGYVELAAARRAEGEEHGRVVVAPQVADREVAAQAPVQPRARRRAPGPGRPPRGSGRGAGGTPARPGGACRRRPGRRRRASRRSRAGPGRGRS